MKFSYYIITSDGEVEGTNKAGSAQAALDDGCTVIVRADGAYSNAGQLEELEEIEETEYEAEDKDEGEED